MTTTISEPALEVINLNKAFGGLKVTEDVTSADCHLWRTTTDYRSKWRRQNNAVQSDQRRPAPECRANKAVRHRHHAFADLQARPLRTVTHLSDHNLVGEDSIEHNVSLGLLGLRTARWQMGDLCPSTRISEQRLAARSMQLDCCTLPAILLLTLPMANAVASSLPSHSPKKPASAAGRTTCRPVEYRASGREVADCLYIARNNRCHDRTRHGHGARSRRDRDPS